MFGWLRCLVTGHKRSKRAAHWDGASYVSVCLNCGVAMYRTTDARRSWQVDRRKTLRLEDRRE